MRKIPSEEKLAELAAIIFQVGHYDLDQAVTHARSIWSAASSTVRSMWANQSLESPTERERQADQHREIQSKLRQLENPIPFKSFLKEFVNRENPCRQTKALAGLP